MRNTILTLSLCLASLPLLGEAAVPRVEPLSQQWRYHQGALEDGGAAGLDDSSWRQVQIPHDWAIELPPDPEADGATGKQPWRGEAWYRRRVEISAEDSQRRVYLLFDGAMAEPTVYINGKKAGGWDYGYNSFWVDATQHVKFGESNLIAVHVDTTRHRSRWYPGAGLYRKVTLHVRDAIHAENWGTQVSSNISDSGQATVTVRSEIRNHHTTPQEVSAEVTLLGPDGEPVGEVQPMTEAKTIPAQGAAVIEQEFKLKEFQRWSTTDPKLYSVRLRVLQEEEELDVTQTQFGIRKIEFTPKYGFYLNDKRVPLRGVNLHHDHGPLGAAFYPRAMRRQLEIMKDMGVNAIRTSHNAPAPELLEMCDRMGLLVFNELFDKWDDTADLHDQEQFEAFMRRNVANFVRRDRNHPCVVVWSIGNEIGSVLNDKSGRGKEQVDYMVEQFKRHDATRPVTMGCHIEGVLDRDTLDSLDVQSWNYGRKYLKANATYPDKPTIYSESASALSTRGFYHLPHPENKTDFLKDPRQIDSYDWNAVRWGDLPDVEFVRMHHDRFCAGEFVWTGFDYLGEPTPYGGKTKAQGEDAPQSRSSYFGIVDLVGIPKDRYYLYRSYWAPQRITIHIVPHWNWPDRQGEPTPVYVYTNGDEVELLLNGKSLGRRKKAAEMPAVTADPQAMMDRFRLRWEDVPYEPGELTAVAYLKGKEIGSASVRTADQPEQLRLQPSRDAIDGDALDLAYVLVELTDASGTVCPDGDAQVRFSVTGPGEIIGLGNGDPTSVEPFTGDRCKLLHGKAMVILRSKPGGQGELKVTAFTEGLEPVSATVKVGK